MEQLNRIKYMEESLDLLSHALRQLTQAADEYQRLQPRLQELSEYYSSPLWRQDFDDDSSGKLPKNLKRGVLSEDGIYNFLSEHTDLMNLLGKLQSH